ncbi:MAG: ATPase domain-containing protein, partial [Promethearchaeota archaeon]
MKFPTPKLNSIFEQNIPIEGIVSIYGDFGVGKTTFALQTAINEAKQNNKVIYIYSKPNFPFEKINKILEINCLDSLPEEQSNILDNLIFIKTLDFDDLNTIIFNLEFLILSNLKQKDDMLNLIIIDSITDLYRIELNQENKEKNV